MVIHTATIACFTPTGINASLLDPISNAESARGFEVAANQQQKAVAVTGLVNPWLKMPHGTTLLLLGTRRKTIAPENTQQGHRERSDHLQP